MMKSRMFLAAALAAVCLASCATTSGTSPPGTVGGAAAARTVFATKSAYEAALTAAVAYKNLPVCATPAKQPCSKPEIVAQLQKADNVAAGALDAAEAAVRTPSVGSSAQDKAIGAATAALAALNAVLTSVGGLK